MKIRSLFVALGFATTLTGCNTLLDTFTISDAEVKHLSEQACKQMDAESKVAPASSKYSTRLKKIAKNLGSTTESGVPLNYKVYMTKDVNAWAMANGCVRVYSGLMDLMTDDEVQGVLGHEIGHVELGHSKEKMQTAYAVALGRDAIAAYGGEKAAELSQSQLGDLTENLINAQFSQAAEREADNFSFDLLKKKKLNTMGLATAFDKLAAGGSNSSMFSSHPDAGARAQNIRDRIQKEGK